MNSAIGKRYAKALFQLAAEENVMDEVRSGLDDLSRSMRENPELSEACLNPMFGSDEHGKVLDALMKRQGCHSWVVRFVRLLAAKHRLMFLHDIVRFYGELVDSAKGVETVHVRSPRPLSGEELHRLKSRLEAGIGRKVALSVEEVPELLAGITVKVGSQVFDGTVRGRLAELRRSMLHELRANPAASR